MPTETRSPQLGDIVEYVIDQAQADQINEARAQLAQRWGAHAEAGQAYPLIITRVHGDQAGSAVNGQLVLDGNDSLWVTSVLQGAGPRHWLYPEAAETLRWAETARDA